MIGLRKKGFRSIPFEMFNAQKFGLDAKNARILERIYHKGQANAWDGKEVLDSLIETHGVPSLSPEKKAALGRVFGIIMWGELAAWRISAELADEIEPLEAKMAATSQAFDEARHFYVMHDYLKTIDAVPNTLDWGARKLLEGVMNADHLAKKLLGMQLMIEPVALTLFHVIKKLDVEPVLTHLLPYYERDEARHVALGVQYLPAMLKQMSPMERLSLWGFQFKLISLEIWSNISLSRDLMVLGVDPRTLMDLGKGKQTMALDMVLKSLGMSDGKDIPSLIINRYADAMGELTIPATEGETYTMRERIKRAAKSLIQGNEPVLVELTPDVLDSQVPLIESNKRKRQKSNSEQGPKSKRKRPELKAV
jgi:hypothetical protein